MYIMHKISVGLQNIFKFKSYKLYLKQGPFVQALLAFFVRFTFLYKKSDNNRFFELLNSYLRQGKQNVGTCIKFCFSGLKYIFAGVPKGRGLFLGLFYT